ncbi:tetraspanin-31 [Hydra vulgaris]|uniref:Tetraspanin-31 n=1 Tax=Hydra vulgaris TaxID=6087 RepID=T2MDP2_HYDVU|nr:tetraspanin-31 [Hydra vulgaris]
MPRIKSSKFVSGRKAVKSCAYTCSRNTLAAINTLFIFLGLVLIGIAAYGKKTAFLVSVPALTGVIACGVFILLIAVLGLVGAIRHNQVLLFFYMVVMSLMFIFLIAFSVAALAVTREQQTILIKTAWNMSESQRLVVEKKLGCCGLFTKERDISECNYIDACNKNGSNVSCPACYDEYQELLDKALTVSGGVGLFFSFSLLLAVYLTVRYRNQKDPRQNADAFL